MNRRRRYLAHRSRRKPSTKRIEPVSVPWALRGLAEIIEAKPHRRDGVMLKVAVDGVVRLLFAPV